MSRDISLTERRPAAALKPHWMSNGRPPWATASTLRLNTAKVHVYEGANNQWATLLDTVNRALSDGHARVLSMSWGGAELYNASSSTMDSYHAVFNQMVGQGWTLVAASGDGGATADCADHLSVSYPASDPDVTAAGGTTLEGGEYGYLSETAWRGGPYGCSYNDGGSGGGCSAYYSAPGYQSRPACGANSRSLPDLALNADWVNTPQWFSFNEGLYPTRRHQHCGPGDGRILRPSKRVSTLYREHRG